jgi:hypothetical protein
MNALITGIVAFFFFALGAICPHDFIYVPALLSGMARVVRTDSDAR